MTEKWEWKGTFSGQYVDIPKYPKLKCYVGIIEDILLHPIESFSIRWMSYRVSLLWAKTAS